MFRMLVFVTSASTLAVFRKRLKTFLSHVHSLLNFDSSVHRLVVLEVFKL